MAKRQNLTQILCEIGIFSAIGYILDEFQSIFFKGVFVNGGSIGFAMIVVIIIGYRRGFLSALFTGLIIGLFDLATGAYIIHPAQLVLDYLISYACVAAGVLLKPLYDRSNKHKTIILVMGVIIGGLAKFLSHYLSGIIFWANPSQFAWGLNNFSPYLYCFIYNIAFIGPSIVITSFLIWFISKKGSRLLEPKVYEEVKTETEKEISKSEVIVSSATLGVGLTLFIYYLIDYIKSFSIEQSATTVEYSFSQNSMVIFLIGLFIIGIGSFSLYDSIKKIFSYNRYFNGLILVSLMSLIYSMTLLIKSTQKGIDYMPYIIWFIISVILGIVFILLKYFISKKKK